MCCCKPLKFEGAYISLPPCSKLTFSFQLPFQPWGPCTLSFPRACACVRASPHSVFTYVCMHMYIRRYLYVWVYMGWLRSVGSIKLRVSFAEYYLFYRALLQKRPMILSILNNQSHPISYAYQRTFMYMDISCPRACIRASLHSVFCICINLCSLLAL